MASYELAFIDEDFAATEVYTSVDLSDTEGVTSDVFDYEYYLDTESEGNEFILLFSFVDLIIKLKMLIMNP
ncbi:hypothetical protein WA026_016988 [Henosepilachna vigintioctopunctata]|uniref:Uncharacterized protein n=1 Tax=Henosepilachna vigintioctopunctata TaxID=420089 RepID=A0AAW1UDB0_9CUCU